MHRILCRQCPKCRLFNDFSVKECECGENLNSVEAQFVDKHKIPPEQLGEVNSSLRAYVQKCSACGALNYTDDPECRVKVCYNCHKARVAMVTPIECIDNDAGEDDAPESKLGAPSVDVPHNARKVGEQVSQRQTPHLDDDNEDDMLDSQTSFWLNIKSGISNVVSGSTLSTSESAHNDTARSFMEHEVFLHDAETQDADGDDDDDDLDAGNWSSVFGKASSGKSITLTAIRYGRLSFTLEAGQGVRRLIGRSAELASFLAQDLRVGNEHCYLLYRDGAWFVKDNNSNNGTAVNSRDIGQNGEFMLNDGDELKLGHEGDSMAFRITIS